MENPFFFYFMVLPVATMMTNNTKLGKVESSLHEGVKGQILTKSNFSEKCVLAKSPKLPSK